MKQILKIFLKGLIVLTPVVITFFIVYKGFHMLLHPSSGLLSTKRFFEGFQQEFSSFCRYATAELKRHLL